MRVCVRKKENIRALFGNIQRFPQRPGALFTKQCPLLLASLLDVRQGVLFIKITIIPSIF